MEVVGLFGQTNRWTHDHSIAYSNNGKISKYAQLERITRRKYDNGLPNYLSEIGQDFNLSKSEVRLALVNTFALDDKFFKVSSNDFRSTDGAVRFLHEGTSTPQVVDVSGSLFGEERTATIVPHELAHVFTSVPFYSMFKDNSLLVHIDGAASVSNSSVWHYKSGEIHLIHFGKELHSTLMSFSYNDLARHILEIPRDKYLSMPGKLMGYSSYGRYHPKMIDWLRANEMFWSFGKYPLDKIKSSAFRTFGYEVSLDQRSQFSMDIAYGFQKNFEDKLLEYINRYRMQTGAEYLYYSGGAALNIKFNSKLLQSGMFKNVYIPPPAGDSGLSLGAVSYINFLEGVDTKKSSVYLNNHGIPEWQYDPEFSVDEVCRLLSEGKVIGVRTGYAEAGPRALGHRSILAIPEKEMFQKVSIDLKRREWYRPLAPIVLEQNVSEIFEDEVVGEFAKYMLQEFKVKERYRERIPAVVHVDNTSRPQVVDPKDPDLRLISEILTIMDESYGYPCLINTSFNVAGEPIVHTADDAMKSAKLMGLDGLIIDNTFLRKGDW